MMKKEMMSKVAALAEFDEALYSVGGDGEEAKCVFVHVCCDLFPLRSSDI